MHHGNKRKGGLIRGLRKPRGWKRKMRKKMGRGGMRGTGRGCRADRVIVLRRATAKRVEKKGGERFTQGGAREGKRLGNLRKMQVMEKITESRPKHSSQQEEDIRGCPQGERVLLLR